MLKREAQWFALSIGAVLLAACGASNDRQAAADGAPVAEAMPATPEAPIPDGEVPASAAAAAPAEVAPPATPAAPAVAAAVAGEWTDGIFTLRVSSANLRISDENRLRYNALTTIRFENGSQQPVSIIVGKNGRPTMAFGNGLRGRSSSYDDLQLLQECSDTIESCQSEKSADFVEVAAGSGIDFNANFRGSDDNVTRDEIKEIVSGTINMRLYVVGPGGFRRTLDVSIANAPIQDRVQ